MTEWTINSNEALTLSLGQTNMPTVRTAADRNYPAHSQITCRQSSPRRRRDVRGLSPHIHVSSMYPSVYEAHEMAYVYAPLIVSFTDIRRR